MCLYYGSLQLSKKEDTLIWINSLDQGDILKTSSTNPSKNIIEEKIIITVRKGKYIPLKI